MRVGLWWIPEAVALTLCTIARVIAGLIRTRPEIPLFVVIDEAAFAYPRADACCPLLADLCRPGRS
jgi:hypothetical protein